MATEFNFNGRLIKLPGVYTEIKSGINNSPLNFSYGNVLVIDKSATNKFGGGAGIDGELEQGEDSIYGFDNIRDFRRFIGGGELWDNAAPLFRPFGAGSSGVSTLWYVRAVTTTAAKNTITWANGSLEFQVKHEGLAGNGEEVSNVLSQGFAITMEAGIVDPTKFRLRFWRGTFTGNDENGRAYDGLGSDEATPVVLATSKEFSTIEEIVEWAEVNFDFNNSFKLKTSTGSGAVTAADLAATVGNQLFAGGTQVNNSQSIDQVLDAISKLDYTHILSMDSGADALSADNFKILYHLENEAKYEKFLVVAGGKDKDTFEAQSIVPATTFNSHRVIVVHGGCYENDRTGGTGLREKNVRYKAAYVLGRTAGLEPQTPPTFKGLGYAGEIHKLTDRERERALEAGVLSTYFDGEIGSFVITQGINTLQQNTYLVNENGTSFSWQLMRIAAQLNKEIEINAKVQLLGNQFQGPNRATISPEVVVEWVKGYLKRKTATATQDNLILSFQDVTVSVKQDAYCINYAFTPNFEVNKLFFTGLIIDPNL